MLQKHFRKSALGKWLGLLLGMGLLLLALNHTPTGSGDVSASGDAALGALLEDGLAAFSNGQDDLLLDFGASGLWVRTNNVSWTRLHPSTAGSMVAGNLDGSSQDEAIIDFGASGIWVRYNETSWAKLHSVSPKSMTVGDMDGYGKDELIVDFGPPYGIYVRYNNTSWSLLHPGTADHVATGDLDGNGQDEAIIDFGASGIWVRMNNTSWTKLHPSNPDSMVTGDVDGSGEDDVIVDFGPSGVWAWMNNLYWTKIHPSNPDQIVVGDLDDNGEDDLVIDFGAGGVWVRYHDHLYGWMWEGQWTKLHPSNPESMAAGDMDGNGAEEVVIDFGASGTWVRYNNITWTKLHSGNPEDMCFMTQGGILAAKEYFEAAVTQYPTDTSNDGDAARFFYALTRIAALGFDVHSDGNPADLNRIADLLDLLTCSPAGRGLEDSGDPCPDIWPTSSPTGQDYQTFLATTVRDELEGAIANLDDVSESFNVAWRVPEGGDMVESDYGDVLYFKGWVKGALGLILLLDSYNLNADLDLEINNPIRTRQQFLASNPSFLTLRTPNELVSARSNVDAGLIDLDSAIDWIQTEIDDQTDDLINLFGRTPLEIEESKQGITTARACLVGPCTIDDHETPVDGSDDFIIDLSPLFAGVNIRGLLPSYSGDQVIGFLPDPTFGGLLSAVSWGNPSVLNSDVNANNTADIFEDDIYFVYGINDISGLLPFTSFDLSTDPEVYGFTLLGAGKDGELAKDFVGAYTYYLVGVPDWSVVFGEPEPWIGGVQFLGNGQYCCPLFWTISPGIWFYMDGTGRLYNAEINAGDYILMEAPPETTGIRVEGSPF